MLTIQEPTLSWNGPLTPIDPSKIDSIGVHHAAAEHLSFLECHEEHRNRIENGVRWNGIGYAYYVQKDGQVFKGRGFNVNAGISGHNGHVLSICFEGNYDVEERMPDVQFNAGVALLEWLRPKLPNLKLIEGHKYFMATACPGRYFPLADLKAGVNRGQVAAASQPVQAPATLPSFSFPNNARTTDDLYIRDEAGNRIPGRWVSKGDRITVLDVSYSKQLALVEYPTASGVRKGYVKNTCIQYLYQGQYQNGSTPEVVYDGNGTRIGSLSPREAATPLYKKNGKLHVVYNTDKGNNTKSGYVVYNGGFNKF